MQNDSRPNSGASNSSFDFMQRPTSNTAPGVMNTAPSGGVGGGIPSGPAGLSRTDQVVLRYFWEDKYAENARRDLHFVSNLLLSIQI